MMSTNRKGREIISNGQKKMVTESCSVAHHSKLFSSEGCEGCGEEGRRHNRTCPVKLLVQP